MSDKYKGERLYALKDAIGKTVADVCEDGDFVFFKFDDGSFVYGDFDEDLYGNLSVNYHGGISVAIQNDLGILHEDYMENERHRREVESAQAKASRRKMYDELRQEFEGEKP